MSKRKEPEVVYVPTDNGWSEFGKTIAGLIGVSIAGAIVYLIICTFLAVFETRDTLKKFLANQSPTQVYFYSGQNKTNCNWLVKGANTYEWTCPRDQMAP